MEVSSVKSMLITTWFLLFLIRINQAHSARILGDPSKSTHHHHNSHHHLISFYMEDVLSEAHQTPQRPSTTKLNGYVPLPFSKPLGLFPPTRGIPIPNPTIPVSSFSAQTFDLPGIARATLQEMEFGMITTINKDLFQNSMFESTFVGKAQGIYVASSEDGNSHMMAITASFASNEYKDGLRFFGVHRTDFNESHVAVIGGIGKFQNANGYATIKSENLSSNAYGRRSEGANNKLLLFNVYLG